MNWEQAFKILEPLATDDLPGGAWHPIRKAKLQAFFELAQSVSSGCIVELGTFRGLGAIALALGASVPVYTVDDRKSHPDYPYANTDAATTQENFKRAGVNPVVISGDVLEIAKTWNDPVELLVWDLGLKDRVVDDVKAWARHITPDGTIAVKELEDGSLGSHALPSLGLAHGKLWGDGCVCAYNPARWTALWIVNGDRYITEARESGASVREQMPFVQFTFGLSGKPTHPWFVESIRILLDELVKLPEGKFVLWLDSDTYMAEPVPELFQMLDDGYDIALAHAPGHRTAPTVSPVPDCYPEFNIGVIAMKNTPRVRDVWQAVYDRQTQYQRVYGNNDQAALREVLYFNDVRVAVIPWEYNCRFTIGGYLRDPVKILHGRTYDYRAVAAALNAATKARWGERRYG